MLLVKVLKSTSVKKFKAVEFLRKIDEIHDADSDKQEEIETAFGANEICDSDTGIGAWLQDIEEEAKESVSSSDDGDRDNILENKEFAKLFIKLCKMLPLFSAISNKFFDSPNPVGSSWSSETYFKNVKQLHGKDIPCSADMFIKRDIQLTNASVIKASQKCFSIQTEGLDFNDDDTQSCANDESFNDDLPSTSLEVRSKEKQVLDAKDISHEEKWDRSSKSKSSKYTRSVPNWNLIGKWLKSVIWRMKFQSRLYLKMVATNSNCRILALSIQLYS